MKKTILKKESHTPKQTTEESDAGEMLIQEMADINSIQEFIELKKLQNRILGKMIEKLNPTENQNKSNNK